MRLLVAVAHPDDEAFGCGSVLAHASAHGVDATVVCATRGELGEPAPGCGVDPSRLGDVREAELRQACAELGVERVEVLGWVDSGLEGPAAPGSLAAADPRSVTAALVALVGDVRPDVVVTLDASDGHRDHGAIRDATLAAVGQARHRPARTYLWCLARSLLGPFTGDDSLGTPDAEITTVVDVGDLVDQRWRAMRAHASQVPPYDAMDAELQLAFLATDRLRRVDPLWAGDALEDDWIPAAD
ncbi:MAG: PIG-L deacetylase family protein [Acidimicrobiales bacterium]